MQLQQDPPAKFVHDSGHPRLRLQVFVVVRDAQRRILCLRERGATGWRLPGSLLTVNEAPDDAARRVVATWLRTPLQLWLAEAQNFPATGPEDDKWYLVLVYEADAPDRIETAPHVEAAEFFAPGAAPPGGFAAANEDVWARLGA